MKSCLKCGTKKKLTRHHIVPRCFAQYIFKDIWRIDNVAKLCKNCHRTYHKYTKIEEELLHPAHSDFINSKVKALIEYKDRMPDYAISDLQKIVTNYFGYLPSDDELRDYNESYEYRYDSAVREFGKDTVEKMWREDFKRFIAS